MHIAALQQKNVDLMKLLHKYHFDWNVLSMLNNSIFLGLCLYGSVDCTKFLMLHCARWIDIKQIGTFYWMYKFDMDCLNWAVQEKNEQMVEYLLKEIYIDDNRYLIDKLQCDGKNALHRASTISIFKMLIEIGKGDPNIPDSEGYYLIHYVFSIKISM